MVFSDIYKKYSDYVSGEENKNQILSNIFFLAYGASDELSDKNLFKFFNSKKVMDSSDYRKDILDENLIELIKNIFNMSCEKISVIPKIDVGYCCSANVVFDNGAYFDIMDKYGSSIGAVLISGLSGEIFNKHKENSFSGIVSTELVSDVSAMSIRVIHSISPEIKLDLSHTGKKEKPYCVKLSLLSGGSVHKVKLITGTLSFCKNLISNNNRDMLSKMLGRRGASVNSIKIEPDSFSGLDNSI